MSMLSFTGSAVHTIDAKGRLFIPTDYRLELGGNFTLGLNNDLRTLALYPEKYWQSKCAQYARIPETDRRGTNYVRYVLGNAFINSNLDAQGRLLIPQTLREMIELSDGKSVRFIGVGHSLEIWNKDRYLGLTMEPNPEADEILDYINERYFNA